MAAKAYVQQDFMSRWTEIALVENIYDSKRRVLTWPKNLGGITVEEAAVIPDECILRLPENITRALYEGLAEHYGGLNAEHVVKLREDYELERVRVDKFINYVIGD